MAEDERTVESTEETRNTVDVDAETAALDAAAETFVELEADLDIDDSAGAADDRIRGIVTDADRVAVDAVPEGYPVDIGSEEALALTVDSGTEETTVYLDWPGEGDAEAPLTRLLAAMDCSLSDLYGRELLLERVGEHYAVVTPTETPRGSGAWSVGVLGGHALAAALLALAVGTGGLPLPAVGLWLGLSLLWLPYATFRDAWYLRTHSDWDGGPLFWAVMSAIPVLNLLAGIAYLSRRADATFFGPEPSIYQRVRRALGRLSPVAIA